MLGFLSRDYGNEFAAENLGHYLFDAVCGWQIMLFLIGRRNVQLVAEGILEIEFSGTWNQPKNVLNRQVEQGFYSFFSIFDYFSKFRSSIFSTCVLLFEKSSNMSKKLAKNEEKPC